MKLYTAYKCRKIQQLQKRTSLNLMLTYFYTHSHKLLNITKLLPQTNPQNWITASRDTLKTRTSYRRLKHWRGDRRLLYCISGPQLTSKSLTLTRYSHITMFQKRKMKKKKRKKAFALHCWALKKSTKRKFHNNNKTWNVTAVFDFCNKDHEMRSPALTLASLEEWAVPSSRGWRFVAAIQFYILTYLGI